MADCIVAYLHGDWAAVVQSVQAVFARTQFILLAEGFQALEPLCFKGVLSLDVGVRHPRGRAFDRLREVRWRTQARGRFVVTYLSESAALPAQAGFTASQEQWQVRPAHQKLYGTWSDTAKDWVEVSVPGIRHTYQALTPTSPAPHALQIETVDYLHDGLVQMTRFCAVTPYKG